MKKIISLFTACLLVFSLAACDAAPKKSDVAPYETYKAAVEKISGADSMHMDMDLLLSMSYDMGGAKGTMDMNMDMEIKAKMKDNEVDVAEYKVAMELMGQKMDISAYMADGYIYSESNGEKSKEAIETGNSNLMGMEDMSADMLGDLKDAIISEDAKQEGGDTVITLKIDGKKAVGGFIESFMENMGDSMGDMEMNEITVVAKVGKDETLKSVSVEFPLEVTEAGAEMDASCKIDITYVQIGGVEITAPADLDSYK